MDLLAVVARAVEKSDDQAPADVTIQSGDPMRIPPRKRIIKTACLLAVIGAVLLAGGEVPYFLASDLVLIGSVEASRIGEPPDKVDAYVKGDHGHACYFVRFAGLRVLKGAYAGDALGVRLHSPAVTFGIRDDRPQGRRYLLYLRYVMAPDKTKVLLLVRNLRTYL